MAKTQYLDLTGLTKYDEEIKAHINSIASGKANSSHTHNYAGSTSAGGAATSANKINTDAGSATNPVYFSSGVPVKTTYTLGASVPSNAKFTDTTYGVASSSTAGLVKIGFTESGKDYPVELNSSGQMFVNVPWVNTTYTSLKNPNKLTIKGADTSVEAYDGSAVGEVNIVAGSNVSVSASDRTITISSTDTNTHYKAVPHAGTSSSTSATATTNGNTYINIVENSSRSGGVNIKGSGATTVTSDSSGVITINSTDTNTNTTYTLSGALNGNTFINTLTPSSGNATTATVPAMTAASSSSAGKAGLVPAPASGKQASFLRGDGTWVVPTNTTYSVVSTTADGLAPKRDGSTSKFLRGDGTWAVPPDTNTVTTVSTTGSGNAVTSITASNGALTVTKDSTFLTAHPAISKSDDTTSTASPAHGGTFTVVDSVARDSNGHVTKINTKTVTLPTDNDTKNTAGSSNTSSKIFLVGATSQAANPQTYSHDTAYVGTDGCLYSNSTKVSVEGHTHSYLPLSGGTITGNLKVNNKFTVGDNFYVIDSGNSTMLRGGTGEIGLSIGVNSDDQSGGNSGAVLDGHFTSKGATVDGKLIFDDTSYSYPSADRPYIKIIDVGKDTEGYQDLELHTNGDFRFGNSELLNVGTPTASSSAANKSYVDNSIHLVAVTTGGTGDAYTATVTGISALSVGVSFIMIPNVVSTTNIPTLNVNSLGAKSIKRRLSNLSSSLQNGYSASWLAAGIPYRVTYDGTYWVVEGQAKPAVADLYGLEASATELNYCKGVTSAIQTQINAKVPTSRTVNGKALSSNISLTYSDVGAVQNGGVTGQDGTHSMALSWNGSDVIAGIDNNAAVKTLIDKETIRTAVTISGLASGSGYDCYYYPDLGICMLRLYYTGGTISATTLTTLGTVASGYRPSSIHSFAVYKVQSATKDMQAQINSSGQIRLYSESAKVSTDDMYITGFWFV